MSVLTCQFCDYEHDWEEAEIDEFEQGFRCLACDGYTYMDGLQRHRFTLILEDGKNVGPRATTSVPVKFKKQLSVLRYAGGKSKFIPVLYTKLHVT